MKIVSIGEYRELITKVWDRRNEAIAATTSHDQRCKIMLLEESLKSLKECSIGRKIAERDRHWASFVSAHAEILIRQKRIEFDRADANWQRMSFGDEFR